MNSLLTIWHCECYSIKFHEFNNYLREYVSHTVIANRLKNDINKLQIQSITIHFHPKPSISIVLLNKTIPILHNCVSNK